MFTIAKINITVAISFIAKRKLAPSKKRLSKVPPSLERNPKTKSAPALEKMRSFLIHPAKKPIMVFPNGIFNTNIASKNCKIKPTITVFRLIFFLLLDIK